MPGPVSDAYHPEFSTDANAEDVRDMLRRARDRISTALGPELKNILEVAHADPSDQIASQDYELRLSEQELRAFRFAIDRSLETI